MFKLFSQGGSKYLRLLNKKLSDSETLYKVRLYFTPNFIASIRVKNLTKPVYPVLCLALLYHLVMDEIKSSRAELTV